jgi:hypothetical protein
MFVVAIVFTPQGKKLGSFAYNDRTRMSVAILRTSLAEVTADVNLFLL